MIIILKRILLLLKSQPLTKLKNNKKTEYNLLFFLNSIISIKIFNNKLIIFYNLIHINKIINKLKLSFYVLSDHFNHYENI